MDLLQGIIRTIGGFGWPMVLVTLIIENESCSKTLFNDNFLDQKCLSLAISKSISYCLILGACLYKIPVVLKVIQKKGGDGLNMLAMYLETSAFVASIFYSYLMKQPLTTYGDLFAVISANIVIILLVWLWGANGQKFSFVHIFSVLIAAALFVFAGASCPVEYYAMLANYSTVVLMLSRLPQIISNATTGNIGVQSAVTIGNSMLGCFAKIFVLFVEANDWALLAGSILAFLCNLILFCQVMLIKPPTDKEIKTSSTASESEVATSTARSAGSDSLQKRKGATKKSD